MDGRFFPWGDAPTDPSWCHMKDSQRGRPRPAEVGGYPFDESVYGVQDIAGNIRDWTGTAYRTDGDVGDGEGGPDRVGRGGSWGEALRGSRLANRGNSRPDFRSDILGFRLSRTVP